MGTSRERPAPSKSISVVVPAYNEEARIGQTLDRIVAYLAQRDGDFEVIVVDDGSHDRTGEVVNARAAQERRIRLETLGRNQGKGEAVRRGMLAASGDWVLFSDADLSTPIEEIEKLGAQLDAGYAIAIGSRTVRGADVQVRQPWYREAMGKTFNLFVRLMTIGGFVDTQCGFKCFTRDAAQAVFRRARIKRFAFDVEALVLARQLGFSIAEVPIRWMNEPNSRVAIVRDSTRMLIDLARIRWNLVTGRYREAPLPAHPSG